MYYYFELKFICRLVYDDYKTTRRPRVVCELKIKKTTTIKYYFYNCHGDFDLSIKTLYDSEPILPLESNESKYRYQIITNMYRSS